MSSMLCRLPAFMLCVLDESHFYSNRHLRLSQCGFGNKFYAVLSVLASRLSGLRKKELLVDYCEY